MYICWAAIGQAAAARQGGRGRGRRPSEPVFPLRGPRTHVKTREAMATLSCPDG